MTTTDQTPARALPGLDGAIHYGETGAIAADRVVDDTRFNVTLDVTGQIDFRALMRAVYNDAHLLDAVRILRYSNNEIMLVRAANRFREATPVQNACTLTLGPSQAENLGEHLVELGGTEPLRCEERNGDCSNFVQDDGRGYDVMGGLNLCPTHLAVAQGHR